MVKISNIIISDVAPNLKDVGWLLPLENGTFKLMFFGLNGWTDAASGTQGPQGPAGQNGADGKSVTAIDLSVDAEGNVTGGTATLSDKSTIEITVTKSEG